MPKGAAEAPKAPSSDKALWGQLPIVLYFIDAPTVQPQSTLHSCPTYTSYSHRTQSKPSPRHNLPIPRITHPSIRPILPTHPREIPKRQPDRNPRPVPGPLRRPPHQIPHIRVHPPGTTTIDHQPRVVPRQRPRQPIDTRLAQRVRRAPAVRAQLARPCDLEVVRGELGDLVDCDVWVVDAAFDVGVVEAVGGGDGREVDDAAAGGHQGQQRLTHGLGAGVVGADDAGEFLRVAGLGVVVAGVVDEDVDVAVVGFDAGCEVVDVGFLGYVELGVADFGVGWVGCES